VGVGQSSWGPAVYGIVGDPGASQALAERVRKAIGTRGFIYEGAFSVGGARVWREEGTASDRKGGSFPGD
jgi:beta-ribofuranosylaminobenzene 5'-phosphate synthase